MSVVASCDTGILGMLSGLFDTDPSWGNEGLLYGLDLL